MTLLAISSTPCARGPTTWRGSFPVLAALVMLVAGGCDPDYATPRDAEGVPVACALSVTGYGGLFDENGGLVESFTSDMTGYFACKDKEAATRDKTRAARVDRVSDGSCAPVEGGIGDTPHCETDAECATDEACVCGLSYTDPSIGPDSIDASGAWNVCLAAECRSADDCGGWPCALSRHGCALADGLFCMSPADECASDMDCDEDAPECGYETSEGRWVCRKRLSECD